MRKGIVIAILVAVIVSVLTAFSYDKVRHLNIFLKNLPDYNKPDSIGQRNNIFYYNEEGVELWNTKGSSAQHYVIKTKKCEKDIYTPEELKGFDDFKAVKVLAIADDIAKLTEKKIRAGNVQDDIVKSNIVEVFGKDVFRLMFEVIGDDGRGGNDSVNNKEYGGYINNRNAVIYFRQGIAKRVCEKSSRFRVSLPPIDRPEFHSHPSGCWGKPAIFCCPDSMDSRRDSICYYAQGPSTIDIDGLKKKNKYKTGYVFGMRSKTIYLYNEDGIVATLPFTFFNDSSSVTTDHR